MGATHDLRYNLLEPRWMQIFISGAKKRKYEAKTVQYAFDNPWKYHDAILKCAGLSKYELPPEYRPKMKAYLGNMKIEKNKAKGNLR